MTFGLTARAVPSRVLLFAFLIYGLGTCLTPSDTNAAITKRVFLTSGTSWTVPSDWTSSGSVIDAIGSGGDGSTSAAGGGGGAFARITSLSLTGGASVTYQIGTNGSDTVFNSTATDCTGLPTPSVCGDGGANASGSTNGAGGTTVNSVGTTEFAGGTASAGGGGGAGGPNGAGNNGASGTGGSGDAGFGGAGGVPGEAGGDAESGFSCVIAATDGGSGVEYSNIPTYGSGGGGAVRTVVSGADNNCFPSNGGTYGAGGGGGDTEWGIVGQGANGLIVITYTSTDTGSSSNAKVKIIGGKVQIVGGRVLIQ